MVTRRKWDVASRNDVLAVIETLNREKVAGKLTVNFGPGGVVGAMEFEERSGKA